MLGNCRENRGGGKVAQNLVFVVHVGQLISEKGLLIKEAVVHGFV